MIDPKHIIELSGRSYPLYAGILAEAHERGLAAIETALVQIPTDANENTAIVKATVRMKDGSMFEDFGDASPRNTNSRIATALLRMASTRAKGRALRDAINCGQTMLEELPDSGESSDVRLEARQAGPQTARPETTATVDQNPTQMHQKRPGRPAPRSHVTPNASETWTAPNGKTYSREELALSWAKRMARVKELGMSWRAFDIDNAQSYEIYEETGHMVAAIKANEERVSKKRVA